MYRLFAVALLAFAMSACTSVDTTEHCVLTRYGKVVEEKMSNGLNMTVFSDATCFPMTETNFPGNPDSDEKEVISAQTKDPITVEGDVAIVYKFDPATIYSVFIEKRSPEAAQAEILNSIREGYRNAISTFTVADLFERRSAVADSVKVAIQRKIGKRAVIVNAFVRDIKVPQQIEQARIAATKQAQVLDQAQKQYVIDSVNARANVVKAEGEAKANQLRAQSYSSNAKLLDLEIAKANAEGLAKACNGVNTCVIGGSVMDSWRRN